MEGSRFNFITLINPIGFKDTISIIKSEIIIPPTLKLSCKPSNNGLSYNMIWQSIVYIYIYKRYHLNNFSCGCKIRGEMI